MEKKLLFLSNGRYDLYKVFEEGFKKYSGCEVTTVLYKNYKYKNTWEKVQNFLNKIFLNKNLKKIKASEQNLYGLEDHYDYLVMISAELVLPQHIKKLTQKANHSVAYYWDSFDHIPAAHTIQYFDEAFTFEPKDAKDYNINLITNFYFHEERVTDYDYDLFFLASYDSRYPLIATIATALEAQNQKVVIKQYAETLPDVTDAPKSIEFIDKHISFNETKELMRKSRIILDIHKDIQRGLSFRVYEAMGLGKKLITTNPDIKGYDFYNPNNIFIWTPETKSIPAEFLNTPYEELPEHIYKKYSQENWVKTLLNIKD